MTLWFSEYLPKMSVQKALAGRRLAGRGNRLLGSTTAVAWLRSSVTGSVTAGTVRAGADVAVALSGVPPLDGAAATGAGVSDEAAAGAAVADEAASDVFAVAAGVSDATAGAGFAAAAA